MVLIGMIVGAGAWAVSQHDAIEERSEARQQRSEDRLIQGLNRVESKVDGVMEHLLAE